MANSLDTDQIALVGVFFDQILHCLHRHICLGINSKYGILILPHSAVDWRSSEGRDPTACACWLGSSLLCY